MKPEESIFSKHSGAFATIIAAIIGVAALLYVSLYKNTEPAPTSNNPDTINHGVMVNKKTMHTLTAEDVLTTLKDKKSTELQINQFTKRNQGTKVQWRIIVNDVRPSSRNTDNQGFYLVFHPAYQKEQNFPDIIIASFSNKKENELSSLSEGDFAIVEGKLKFQYRSPWNVSLEESSLIKFTKSN